MAVPAGMDTKVLAVVAAEWPLSGWSVRNKFSQTKHSPPLSIPTHAMWVVWSDEGVLGKMQEEKLF